MYRVVQIMTFDAPVKTLIDPDEELEAIYASHDMDTWKKIEFYENGMLKNTEKFRYWKIVTRKRNTGVDFDECEYDSHNKKDEATS